jgi:hypothetical protein
MGLGSPAGVVVPFGGHCAAEGAIWALGCSVGGVPRKPSGGRRGSGGQTIGRPRLPPARSTPMGGTHRGRRA